MVLGARPPQYSPLLLFLQGINAACDAILYSALSNLNPFEFAWLFVAYRVLRGEAGPRNALMAVVTAWTLFTAFRLGVGCLALSVGRT